MMLYALDFCTRVDSVRLKFEIILRMSYRVHNHGGSLLQNMPTYQLYLINLFYYVDYRACLDYNILSLHSTTVASSKLGIQSMISDLPLCSISDLYGVHVCGSVPCTSVHFSGLGYQYSASPVHVWSWERCKTWKF